MTRIDKIKRARKQYRQALEALEDLVGAEIDVNLQITGTKLSRREGAKAAAALKAVMGLSTAEIASGDNYHWFAISDNHLTSASVFHAESWRGNNAI